MIDGFFCTIKFWHGVKELALGIDLGGSEGSFLDPKISILGQRMGSNLWLRPFYRVILGPQRALTFYLGCSEESFFWTLNFGHGVKESALTFDLGFSDGFFWTINFWHVVKELALGIDLGCSEGSFLDPKISTLGQRMGSNLWLRPFWRVILGPKKALTFYSGCSEESFFEHKNFEKGSKNRL